MAPKSICLGLNDSLGAISMAIARNTFDAVIIGAGGAGMRAALQLANSGLKVALLSKVFLLALTQFLRKVELLWH